MFSTPEQFAAANKATVDSLLSLANTALASAERIAALNLNTARSVMEDSVSGAEQAEGLEEGAGGELGHGGFLCGGRWASWCEGRDGATPRKDTKKRPGGRFQDWVARLRSCGAGQGRPASGSHRRRSLPTRHRSS